MRLRGEPKREPVLVRREITIQNDTGLHARPAAAFARRANSFKSEISLVREGTRFSATSLIEILRANLEQGATVTLEAHGTDAEAAVEGLTQLLLEFRE
jgi:phosphotransferase system HPr (HPr) family protein